MLKFTFISCALVFCEGVGFTQNCTYRLYELPSGSWELKPGTLEEQPVFLTVVLSQAPKSYYYYFKAYMFKC